MMLPHKKFLPGNENGLFHSSQADTGCMQK